MGDHQVQPDWLCKLPSDVLNLIAQRTRDPLTGLTAFRSVCRTWRAAAAPAPRLLPPSPQDGAVLRHGSDHLLVYPLSRGWSIVVDPPNFSCHLSHLAMGTTAPLPNLNALCDGDDDRFTITQHRSPFKIELFSSQEPHEDRRRKIQASFKDHERYSTYMHFSDLFRFHIHVPATSSQAGSTEGIVVMMFHSWLHGRTNVMFFCRPGDATWTTISDPNPEGSRFLDFAYFDGKVFAVNNKLVTLVFDDTTLNILYQVDQLETTNFISKLCSGDGSDKRLYNLHLLALPHKLLLIKVFMSESYSRKPVDFHVFELRHQGPNGQIAWCKVTGEGVGGNYELFMDSYHATFSNCGDGSGTRIYHADRLPFGHPHCVSGYCYNMQDNKLECILEPPKQDDHNDYSTKPSWFVP